LTNLSKTHNIQILQTICGNGSFELAALLKQRAGSQFDVGTQTFDNKETCLHLAVSNGKRGMVRYLLKEYPSLAN
jgi:6-phosphofructokinase